MFHSDNDTSILNSVFLSKVKSYDLPIEILLARIEKKCNKIIK